MSSPPLAASVILSAKPKHKKKTKDKPKDKGHSREKISTQVAAPELSSGLGGRNEGIDPDWEYQPPAGMVALDISRIDEEFDWDSLKNDENKELWIVRVPEGFKTKQLDGLQIQEPQQARGAKLSTLERKRAKYDVWSVDPLHDNVAEDNAERLPMGEEIKTVSCLLPRKKKGGKLYIAPKPISQHIIVTHAPATPHLDTQAAPVPSTRLSVPKHLLKHRFLPFGAMSSDEGSQRPPDVMEIDVEDHLGSKEEIGGKEEDLASLVEGTRTPRKKNASSSQQASAEKIGKKRKTGVGESETPRQRSKKMKL